MEQVQFKTCPTCQQPYGTLPPIGPAPQIVLPDGKLIVPGTISEKPKVAAPQPPKLAFVDQFTAGAPPVTPIIAQPTSGEAVLPYDHPIIGGRVTICVLLYGDYPDLHLRCLGSIFSSTPQNRRQVRVACNAVCQQTLDAVREYQQEGLIHQLVINDGNIKKYPAMRQLFQDPQDPITDQYVIWFDDDSIADKDPLWLPKLLETIIAFHPKGCRLYGARLFFTLSPSQMAWIKTRPWYRNKPFQMATGRVGPNANKAIFASGGFWALATHVIKDADLPDPQIGNNGGDYMVGAQVHQLGWQVKDWNARKQLVNFSSVPRRGLSEIHTGMPGWQPGGVAKNR